MSTIVQIALLDGSGNAGFNPFEVFSLTPVPPELVPPAYAAGTYVASSQTPDRVAVVGDVATVAALLDTSNPTPPTGPAGGDLNGTYPNPGVDIMGFSGSLYVDLTGDDATAVRGSWMHRFKTLGAAMAAAQTGDVIVLGQGTYNAGSTPFQVRGDLINLSIVGQGPDTTILTAAAGTDIMVWQPSGVGSRKLNLLGLRITTSTSASRALVLNAAPSANWAATVNIGDCDISANTSTALFARAVSFTAVEDTRIGLGKIDIAQCNGNFYGLQLDQTGAQCTLGYDPTAVVVIAGRDGLRFFDCYIRSQVTLTTAVNAQFNGCIFEGATALLSSGLLNYAARAPTIQLFDCVFTGVGAVDFNASPLPPRTAGANPTIEMRSCTWHAATAITMTENAGPLRIAPVLAGSLFALGSTITFNGFLDANVRNTPSTVGSTLAVTGTATVDRDEVVLNSQAVIVGANAIAFAPPLPNATYNVQVSTDTPAAVPVWTARGAASVTITSAAVGNVDVRLRRTS